VVLVMIDEQDRVLYEKRLRNDLRLMLAELAPYRKEACRGCGGVDLQLVLAGGRTD
jgi:hypothetical protein